MSTPVDALQASYARRRLPLFEAGPYLFAILRRGAADPPRARVDIVTLVRL